jgi:hypothetical protein
MRAARRIAPLCLGMGAVALSVAGCGGASTGTSTTAATTTAAATTTTTAATVAPARTAPTASPVTHLAILSPQAGAHTPSTLTVHVAATGAPSGSTGRFRYVLDGRVTRTGSSELTFHDLAPGHHTLRVVMLGSPVERTTTFTVNAPAAAPKPVVAQAPPTETQATTPPPAATTPAPAATTPAPTQTRPSGASEGIPQGPNAGDGDGDNHGEPSDGDGDI